MHNEAFIFMNLKIHDHLLIWIFVNNVIHDFFSVTVKRLSITYFFQFKIQFSTLTINVENYVWIAEVSIAPKYRLPDSITWPHIATINRKLINLLYINNVNTAVNSKLPSCVFGLTLKPSILRASGSKLIIGIKIMQIETECYWQPQSTLSLHCYFSYCHKVCKVDTNSILLSLKEN